ncbi:MAG: MFS transporter [Woeseiaceae bacterium]|nr:MFS transporter [Woeseiaceae bacterium]
MESRAFALHRWICFALVSAFFFFITAGTFSSLGVVLPYMIEEFTWSWSQAGTGFSLFALMVGLAGTTPAWVLKRFNVQSSFALGGLLMTSGFCLFALAPNLYQYYAGALLLGVGYALTAAVPGVHVINHWIPDKRSFAIGAYMMIGGLGAVAGPLIVTGIIGLTDSWRMHWWAMAASMLALAVLAVIFVRSDPHEALDDEEAVKPPEEEKSDRVYKTEGDWTFRDALRTPQYYVIVFALSTTLMCTLTMNSWAFTHMTALGVSAAVAAGALAANGAVNAMSRLAGGALATKVDPKWLLCGALGFEAMGMVALSVAGHPVAIALFAIGEGVGFGVVFFATAMLLVNYYGTTNNPVIFGTMNMITTVAMIGPIIAGLMAEHFGTFAITYQIFAFLLMVIFTAVALMRPPGAAPVADAAQASE